MQPHRLAPTDDFAPLLRLIQTEFAYMEDRIDPPSSMHNLTTANLAGQAETAEVWAIGTPAIACMVLTPKVGCLYLGKLAVSATHRGKGLARLMVDLACERAAALGLPAVELQTRVELVENQATFRALGFAETARTAHFGYSRPTSITFRKGVLLP
ncbi:GNAT family N-acetyltransferase [Fuscibacter oryzae]|uniref:GNAT family N-acetyltransferase n=1 Tax=Fuscibacter oryzae TaxID=2803939 RepID=A0A8J7MRK9_9RHOB|nr:GNAT family N-acetyltransferase [Fuscibacter oryzae]MBL4928312.1 GNAT family N-acetyltransferase [Fuscibacter oryzae]